MRGQWRWLWLSRRQRAFLVPFGGALVGGVMLGLLLASGFAFDSNAYKILRDAMVLLGSVLLTWFGWRRVKAADEQNRNQTRALDRQTDQIKLTRDQMELTRRDQLSKRFTEAVKQLGDPKLEIRMGGIAGLWAVATESTHPEDRIMVLDVLCAFVRNTPHPKGDEERKIKPDVEYAMNRLGSVGPYFPWGDVEEGHQPYRRDFSGAYLQGWQCDVGNYNHSNFSSAFLKGSLFSNVLLEYVKFEKIEFELKKDISRGGILKIDSGMEEFSYEHHFFSCYLNGSSFYKSRNLAINMCDVSNCNFFECDVVLCFASYFHTGFKPNQLPEIMLASLTEKPSPTP